MKSSRHQWVLFGVDLKALWHEYTDAWREVFWRHGSVGRGWLDESVAVLDLSLSNPKVPRSNGQEQACALLLPETIYLKKTIQLPKSAYSKLKQVIDAEVSASSPFDSSDTVSGWKVLKREASTIVVQVVIASRSQVLNYINGKDKLDSNSVEVWAAAGNDYVVVNGFGEQARDVRYVRRLRTMGAMACIAFLALTVIGAAPMFYQAGQLEEIQTQYDVVRREAREITVLRESLADKNSLIEGLNELIDGTAHPLLALNTITHLLKDDVWLSSYRQRGNIVEIQGTAANAAKMMQELSVVDDFEDVKATSAFRKIGNKDLERFQIELRFSGRRE